MFKILDLLFNKMRRDSPRNSSTLQNGVIHYATTQCKQSRGHHGSKGGGSSQGGHNSTNGSPNADIHDKGHGIQPGHADGLIVTKAP
jgi:hypothetical protein